MEGQKDRRGRLANRFLEYSSFVIPDDGNADAERAKGIDLGFGGSVIAEDVDGGERGEELEAVVGEGGGGVNGGKGFVEVGFGGGGSKRGKSKGVDDEVGSFRGRRVGSDEVGGGTGEGVGRFFGGEFGFHEDKALV